MNENADGHEERLLEMKRRASVLNFRQQCTDRFACWLDGVLNGEVNAEHHFEAFGTLHENDDAYAPVVRFKVTIDSALSFSGKGPL